ncbi:UNVERIFIED_ORG: hypothetical protein FHR68_000218 [Xanthomonas campestris]
MASPTAKPISKSALSKKGAPIDIDFAAGRTTILQLERIAATALVNLRPDQASATVTCA